MVAKRVGAVSPDPPVDDVSAGEEHGVLDAPSPAPVVVSVEGLVKRFDDKTVVDGLTLDVRAGSGSRSSGRTVPASRPRSA
jgi:hypothetical protein